MHVLHSVPQPSGILLQAPHIEAPTQEFRVRFFSPGYVNVLRFEPGWRWVRVLATTAQGAILTARYHYSRGTDFQMDPLAASP